MFPKEYPLGHDNYLAIRSFQGKDLVHLRRFFVGFDKKLYPTIHGIALTQARFKTLQQNLSCIQDKIKQLDQTPLSLGGDIYVVVNHLKKTVDIRLFRTVENTIGPTRKGITLRFREWERLTFFLESMDDIFDERNTSIQKEKEEESKNANGIDVIDS